MLLVENERLNDSLNINFRLIINVYVTFMFVSLIFTSMSNFVLLTDSKTL